MIFFDCSEAAFSIIKRRLEHKQLTLKDLVYIFMVWYRHQENLTIGAIQGVGKDMMILWLL